MSVRSSSLLAADVSGLSECLDRLAAQKRHIRPVSTYRLQFHRGFRFRDAVRLAPYLHSLGITHCYSSPILKADPGSTHGYDIIDHNQINPEIGSEDEFHELIRELQARGMGLVLDFVPNHMGVGYGGNPWWTDVLENGCASEHAGFFDIDWNPVKAELHNKVLLPILGDSYGAELVAGRIRLCRQEGRFYLEYYEKRLPIDPQTTPIIFETLGDLRVQPSEILLPDNERGELENILWKLRELPPHTVNQPQLAQQRYREIPELSGRFAELLAHSVQARVLVDEAVRRCNGEPGVPRSLHALHRLLEAQAYRLAHWRVSAQEINYRRFFDINDLVGLRMEAPRVFAATHRLIRRLLADGSISGLRLDHPDGLLNPIQYFTRVQMLYAASQCLGPEPQGAVGENGIEIAVQEIFGQHDWMNQQAPLYVLVEKILEPGEMLPRDWPVDGTVGYDFGRLVNGLWIDARNGRALTALYRKFIGGVADFEDLLYQSKKLIMETALSSEVTVLSHMLEELSASDWRARDFTRLALIEAIRETTACFPVYRTYVDERGQVADSDRQQVEEAISRAKRRNPSTAAALYDWLRGTLLLEEQDWAGSEWQRLRIAFVLKFQQLSGPVMAKGLEDTVCYVYNRFLAVNEVGSTPAELGVSIEEFHRGNHERREHWPFAMLATSTHDSKRSEDVRARLDVISEIPREWGAQVMRWRRLNRGRKQTLGDRRTVPDYNEEYFLYQTLVGAWPLCTARPEEHRAFVQRIREYMNKAVHEAKVNLSWVNPNPEYVAAMEAFVERILGTEQRGGRGNAFREEIERFLPPLMFFGAMNSLAQVLIKITVPGVPDFYRGTELWDFSLVDPDNRRPVYFSQRERLLSELDTAAGQDLPALLQDLLKNWRDGRIKLWTTVQALRFRREHRELFQFGSYAPLVAMGEKAEHCVAYTREYGGERVVVAIPRLTHTLMRGRVEPPLGDAWAETELPLAGGEREFTNVLTGERISGSAGRQLLCRELFARFPIVLLVAG